MQLCFNLRIKMQEGGWGYNSVVKLLTDIFKVPRFNR